MAESTLSYTLTDLQGDVGLFLGWGRGAANGDPAWTSRQSATIDGIVKSGLRQFYFPPPLDGKGGAYDWSFLKPVGTASLVAAANTVALPDDFGGFEGRITIQSASGQSYWPVELLGVGTLYAQQSKLPTTTGRPEMACVEPLKGTTLTKGQRMQLRFWPIADATYTLQFQYYILADYLTGLLPYVYGGAQHTETVLESCLAIAEQRLDDASSVHSAKFQERLAASISQDRKSKPQQLGYNGDRSDWQPGHYHGDRRDWYGFPGVTVNGNQY